jgi:hypothetical protein
VGVDVEFADDFAANKDGNDDFGFRFEGAGEVAGVGVDVVDDDGFAAGGRGAANALVERYARVGRHGAFERAEDKHVAAFPFEHVEADPVVAGELFVKQRDDGFHESFAGCGGPGECVELGNDVGRFQVCSGVHRIYPSRPQTRGNWQQFWENLTRLRADTKLLKLSCRGSSLVERRPEKAGVASSILAPGTRFFFSFIQII